MNDTINGKIADTTLVAKMVREQLKKEFPSCKFSVTSRYFSGGSELTISLMSAPFDAFADSLVHYPDGRTFEDDKSYSQLNYRQLRNEYSNQNGLSNGRRLTEQAWSVLRRAVEIGQAQNWDNSDIQSDYFDVNYWFDIQIGKWNKGFEVK
ncbi:MAG: hypothetical protein LC130_25820 [Bryobacterales bacterium]|nr:hypothetical protein [Bryobacterales bacterium]